MINRRDFLKDLTFFSGGLAVAGGALTNRAMVLADEALVPNLKAMGYGEIFPTIAKNVDETFLSLPKGFEYNVIGRITGQMSDGRPTPAAHDGMWTFKVKDQLRIVRNHEVSNSSLPRAGAGIGSTNHYDEMAGGGTTTLVIDPKTRTVVRDFVSLSGTMINCAGGPTPWGSWITCEETTLGPTVRTSSRGVQSGGFPKPHGYCFEVPAKAESTITPVPLKAMGRFTHEAIAVDRKGVVYLTEDYNSCGFYRFIPKTKKKLAEGGTLQMLAITGKPDYDTRSGQKAAMRYEASWVTIDNPDPVEADTDPLAVFKQGKAKGGATFARLEGCCTDRKGRIFFTSTSGGDQKAGQIWMYEPTKRDTGVLTLVFESPDKELLFMPDNICQMPKSQLIFLCEDGDYPGQESKNFLRILTPEGRMADFARNVSTQFPRSEFAGSTFSPDGKTLFVNLQSAGVTLAIWGDWSRFKS